VPPGDLAERHEAMAREEDGRREARSQQEAIVVARRVTFAPSTRCIYARSVRVVSGFGSLGPLAHLVVAF